MEDKPPSSAPRQFIAVTGPLAPDRAGMGVNWQNWRVPVVFISSLQQVILRKYYPPDYWLFTTSADEAKGLFVRELTESLEETKQGSQQVHASFIKIACEETVEKFPTQLKEAVAQASLETWAPMPIALWLPCLTVGSARAASCLTTWISSLILICTSLALRKV